MKGVAEVLILSCTNFFLHVPKVEDIILEFQLSTSDCYQNTSITKIKEKIKIFSEILEYIFNT